MNQVAIGTLQLPRRIEPCPAFSTRWMVRAVSVLREGEWILRSFWMRHFHAQGYAVIGVVVFSSLVTLLMLKTGDEVAAWQRANHDRPRVLTASERQEALFVAMYSRLDSHLENEERMSGEMLALARMNSTPADRSLDADGTMPLHVLERVRTTPPDGGQSLSRMFDRIEGFLARDEDREVRGSRN